MNESLRGLRDLNGDESTVRSLPSHEMLPRGPPWMRQAVVGENRPARRHNRRAAPLDPYPAGKRGRMTGVTLRITPKIHKNEPLGQAEDE